MTSFASSTLRLLHRLVHRHDTPTALPSDAPVVMDGMSAVAATEAMLADAAGLGASYPAASGARLWHQFATRYDRNRYGAPLSAVEGRSPCAALAAALGLSLSGRRATAFIAGPDLLATPHLLSLAVGQHAPLVIHLVCRAGPGHAQALGSSHQAYHAIGDTGLFQLFASNAQEAVDFAMIARWVAERALVPGLVAMDAEQTAGAAQDVTLPGEELLRAFLGEPAAEIKVPTEAQRMLFGDERRATPRPFDLDRPALLGAMQGPESYALGAAGQRTYFHDHVTATLTEAFERFAALSGRRHHAVTTHQTDGADIVLVAQGAAVEVATGLADHARTRKHLKVGVLGISMLRPRPDEAIVQALSGVKTVAVLERSDSPLAGDGPLLREIRLTFEAAREASRGGDKRWREKDVPRFVDVHFGAGGLPLKATDLAALLDELEAPKQSRYFLGLDFVRAASAFPKQQAIMDALRRSNPELEHLGVRGHDPGPDLRPKGALTIAIHRPAGPAFESLAGDIVAMVHSLVGGHVRTRPGISWQRHDEPCVDVVTHSAAPVRDPGDDVPVDIAVIATDRLDHRMRLTDRLSEDGMMLATGTGSLEEWFSRLPSSQQRTLTESGRSLYHVNASGNEKWQRTEALLGGLLALVLQNAGEGEMATSKVRQARDAMLGDVSEEERAQRLDEFVAAYESVSKVSWPDALSAGGSPAGVEDRPPASTRGIDALSRAWDQTAGFYRSGRTDELAATPTLATGALPPMSSTLRDASGTGTVLPEFDPATCDGDPRLWTTCPDASLAPLVIPARALIDRGIEMAGAAGTPADALRALAGKLAKRINRDLAGAETPPRTFGGLLTEAFDAVIRKMDADEDRRTSLQESLDAVVATVGPLPVARTTVFFDEPEGRSPGSGELFALVVNADTCKCPELVLAECIDRGLRPVAQTPESIADARRLYRLWEQLPDTSGATIERLRNHPEVGPLAAIMLSRHCLLAMAGGDGAEPASGAKLALRHIMGLAEFHLQPRQQRMLEAIETLRGKLDERIHDLLASALPARDLDGLASGLSDLGDEDVTLGELATKVDSAVSSGRIDGLQLSRLVDVNRALVDLHWRIGEGPSGQGRARAGAVVAPGSVSAWAGTFPYNPFAGPVVIDACGETAALAMGLLEGQLQQVIDGFSLLRRAQLELDQPASMSDDLQAIAGLRFSDLRDDERELCPPMLVIGDGSTLGSRGLSDIAWLLESGLPVKVVVLSGIGGSADTGLGVDALDSYPAHERSDLALLALLSRQAFVVQASIAETRHFASGVLAALAFPGPALVHVHAPSPERHGFDARRLFHQARIAVDSRAFPLLQFDPNAEGVFGSRLDLSANPAPSALWTTAEGGTAVTSALWATTEARFADHFTPADSGTGPGALEPLDGYLELPADQREGRTPYVTIPDGDRERRMMLDRAMIDDIEQRMSIWRTLQELAGVVTPFTQRVRADIEQEVALANEAELTKLRNQHEARLAQLKAEFETDAVGRVTQGLLTLAGYHADPSSPIEGRSS